MSEPHCSKCCPVQPPAPATPEPLPSGAVVGALLVALAIVGGWLAVVWAGATLFPG
ncbi:hypothetical protein V1460_18730 [Streptomyces sp. SCSIO 30461]|uniref:hypothetical protein n=1 Tax=Streptomyces sp. SCSIO 30461 TaxID=3118085 RepID=UPI0030CF95F3